MEEKRIPKKFTLKTNPYHKEQKLFRETDIEIRDGLTVLVGCNGIGKSSMMKQMQAQLSDENIPYMQFDNHRDYSRNDTGQRAIDHGDMSMIAAFMKASEGELIFLNIGNFLRKAGDIITDAHRGYG